MPGASAVELTVLVLVRPQIGYPTNGSTLKDMDSGKLLALHGHFLAADSVKQFLFADVAVDEETAVQLGDLLDSAQFLSRAMRLQVFYALLYVVVEGYKEFGCEDAAVDRLLAQSGDYVDKLRRFRNAVFHPQEQPISPKLAAYLNAEGSENWTYDLYRALKAFFESQLPIKEWLASHATRASSPRGPHSAATDSALKRLP